ncbi:MAG TPA: efflux RND transporter periplasmic adaptor subunit, partial [Nitrospiria bacterium]|nr:efflux RND transporter periplasmic adaptor subunit [Nitrospiria bacterium]
MHATTTKRDFSAQRLALGASLLAGGLVMALSGCTQAAGSPPAPPVPEVVVATVQPRDLPEVFEYVGQVAGVREVEVRARVSGILERWNYTEGAAVRAGESLFTIDQAPFQAELARAEADSARAQANLAQATRTAGRFKPLWEARAVSQNEYDDALSAEQVAGANVKAAEAAVTRARL